MPGAGKHPSAVRPGQTLTLAQRMGLVERPPDPLTDGEWAAVQERFRERLQRAGDDEGEWEPPPSFFFQTNHVDPNIHERSCY
jgi:hypothetical protein